MAETHHVPDIDQAAVTSFLKAIGFSGPNAVSKVTGISFHTVAKWYRSDPAEMSAVDFLRIVVSRGAQDALAAWLKKPQRQMRVAEGPPPAPPLPKSAMRAVTLAEKSDKKKRRP